MHHHAIVIRRIALAAFLLCLGVVILGAYVRLSDAGLGCPDWPGCYGHLSPLGAASDAHGAFNGGKAWREMLHRYAAGTLGCLIVLIAALGARWRREQLVSMKLQLALPAVLVIQAALGMWTVTWQLRPLIVSLHLLFGFTTLSLLWWLVLRLYARQAPPPDDLRGRRRLARQLALAGLIVLCLQIALGGWTSSNYAAIACPDFPTCQGSWWPQADFHSAYRLLGAAGINYDGGVLALAGRTAIHLSHRLGALAVTLALLAAGLAARSIRGDRAAAGAGLSVLALLALQLTIGISMVLLGFPLWLATAHNAGAALLLLATLGLNRSLRPASTTISFA
ncbi:MAG TPA: COX15/CtaA family protein [Steroidobacteraceae bacterium]|jgi:cytochrome c oxidase assembly protein subunit 15